MTTSTLRTLLFVVSAIQLLFAAAYYFQLPFAVALWPFPGTTPLTFVLVASIFAAAAASTMAALWTRNEAALAGIALDYMVISAPLALYSLWRGVTGGGPPLLFAGVAFVVATFFGAWLYTRTRHLAFDQSIPLPGLLRASFIGFAVALLFVGGMLVLQVPNVIPWTIIPDLSVVIGFMFLGAMVYFIYGLLRPGWANASTQLAGFLAYDLVLIVPFLSRIGSLPPEFVRGQWIYLAVVVYSGLLAIYYLFIDPKTRLAQSRPTPRLG